MVMKVRGVTKEGGRMCTKLNVIYSQF